MALLAVQQAGAHLTFSAGAFVVTAHGVKLDTVPLHEVDEVQLFGPVELSASARNILLRQGVPTLLFDGLGRYLGSLSPPTSSQASRRAAQFATLGSPRAVALARAVVTAKLQNQRQVVLRARRSHGTPALTSAVTALRECIRRVEAVEDLDVLRGIEGHAARMYFAGLADAIRNPAFRFSGRNRRPPRDPVNALLSFGYAVLQGRVESALHRAGLDIWAGALHEYGSNKPCLVLDLMEPYRSAVVDRLVLRLVNRAQLGPDDFVEPSLESTEAGRPLPPDPLADDTDTRTHAGDPTDDDPRPAVYLAPSGRAVLLRELASDWRRRHQHPARGVSIPLAEHLISDAVQLGKWFEDPTTTFTPFLLR